MENNAYAKFWGANKVHFGRCASGVCLKKTKWRMELPGGLACPIPPSMWQFFAGRGRVISGHLANWFGNRFGTNKIIAWSSWPYMTPNDYLNIVLGVIGA